MYDKYLRAKQTNPYDLTVRIQLLMNELIEVGLPLGLHHEITVSMSQRLDEKIIEFQKINMLDIRKILNSSDLP